MRKEKGITLVALIITIVILLILAVVSIGSIQENGLIDKANGAVIKWNEAQKNEQNMFNSYLDYLNLYGGEGETGGSQCSEHTWVHSGYEGGGDKSASNCTVCGYICNHSSLNTAYIFEYSTDTDHIYETRCTYCNRLIVDGALPHWYGNSGKCVCGREQ